MKKWAFAAIVTVTLSAIVGLGLAFAPVVYTELEFLTPSCAPWPPEPSHGSTPVHAETWSMFHAC